MGLPGETYASWIKGLDDLLSAGIKNQLFIYFCQVLPNTEMAAPEYIAKHGMITQRIPLQEVHCSVGETGLVTEYEDIIVQTNTLPLADFRRVVMVSWLIQVFASLKLGYFLLVYLHEELKITYTDLICYLCFSDAVNARPTVLRRELDRLRAHLDAILAGGGRMTHLPEYSDVYLDVDEGSFILLSAQKEVFFKELMVDVKALLAERGVAYDEETLQEVFRYQALRVPDLFEPKDIFIEFKTNIPEYFHKLHTPQQLKVSKTPTWVRLKSETGYRGDKYRYMKERVLFGRKSGLISNEIFYGEGPYPGQMSEVSSIDLKLS
ncbi:MAG: hypothetical protein J0L75_10420 [Spirochaetes bacterium]|nr:hypothetical protein [Spirochaetota bacterium]